MTKTKYKYNPNTLTYEKVKLSAKQLLIKALVFVFAGLMFGGITTIIAYNVFNSPKELMLERELDYMKDNFKRMNKELASYEKVLFDMEERDDNIYRVIFEAEPISPSIRNVGVGGVNRYANLEGFDNDEMIINTNKRLDKIAKKLFIQSKSYDEVIDLALNKELLLASIPAIQPIPNKNLKRMASGYGMRIHPIYKTRKFHSGMDFTAPTGTVIYATGDGVISKTKKSRRGFGNHITIDHGFGYKTIYAHMSKFNVKKGQKVKRGDVIGFVGNTGTSTAPHLHYEVWKNNKRINPINFYFNDLTPDEYDRMIKLSSSANQSFD
ncbi:MAG: M23 family peptidase [Bacteroidetes bacterium]|nr:MAG: M23 family peptidase [Bacteroidota bacterium]